MSKINIGVIGAGRVTPIELHELLHNRKITITADKDKPTCKRCGSTENIMLNGYCVDCEEELESQTTCC